MHGKDSFYLFGTFCLCREGEVFLGPAQVRLLKQVLRDGSIHAAAKNLKMSYQHAWHMLDKLNQISPLPILIRQKGGRDGGGCSLSAFGQKLIRIYDEKELALKQFLDDNNADFERCFF